MRNWLRDVDDVFLHLLVKPADGTGYRQMEVFDYRSSGGHLFGFIGALGLAEFRCGAGRCCEQAQWRGKPALCLTVGVVYVNVDPTFLPREEVKTE